MSSFRTNETFYKFTKMLLRDDSEKRRLLEKEKTLPALPRL